MVKRGRPSLNLTPEERIQRRRLQLVASQRKRRAHKRLAQQPKAETESPDSLPVRPEEKALCQFYDAMFLGSDATNAARSKMSSSDPQAPSTVCHNCGSAPLDTAALTAVVSTHSPTRRPDAIINAYSGMPLFDSILDSLVPHGIGRDGNSLQGELAPTPHPEGVSAPAPAKGTDNIFMLGRFNASSNEWMPTNENETPYGYEKALASRRPPSPSPDETGPTLSRDGVDHLAPWMGTKQAIFMGF